MGYRVRSMRINQMASVDRPREKLLRYKNPTRLKTEELLAIILGTGSRGENVLTLSKRIVKLLEKQETSVQIDQLKQLKGMGPVKTAQIIAVLELGKRFGHPHKHKEINSPKDVWLDLYDIRASKKEQFIGYYLDIKNSLIKREVISVGTLTASLVHPREVFEPAIQLSSARILLAHNHPSGDPTPSPQDITATKRLVRAGELLDIEILDHVIVADQEYVSMKEKGLM